VFPRLSTEQIPRPVCTGINLPGEGYVELARSNWNPRKDVNVKLTFKTLSPSGLLFYLGGRDVYLSIYPQYYASIAYCVFQKDFLSLELRQGRVLGHYNLGSGRAEALTEKRYDDGTPHTVEFARSGKSSQLVMDMDVDNRMNFINLICLSFSSCFPVSFQLIWTFM